MDNIWIVLLILGAVISLTQKSPKRHPQQEPEDEDTARELRKQLEEIFGRREEHHSAPRPTATPKTSPARSDAMPQTPPPYPATETKTAASGPSMSSEAHMLNAADRHVRDTSHRNKSMTEASARRQLQTENNDISPQRYAAATSATTHHSDSELERIIGEFDMERAVIYSEILKPKYEEY